MLCHSEGVVSLPENDHDLRWIHLRSEGLHWNPENNGELFHKIEQLDKCGAVDLHRDMLTVEYDTVFIIVYVWRVLEAPFAVIDGDGDDPVVFSGRMIEPSGIAFIFHAKLTFRISTCFCISGSGNGFGDPFLAWTD